MHRGSVSQSPSSDVNGIVELVYQRLQAERPAYDDVHTLPDYSAGQFSTASAPHDR